MYCLAANEPGGEFRVVLPRVHETEYDFTHHRDENGVESFFIRTNDGANTFRVVEAPAADSIQGQLEGSSARARERHGGERQRFRGSSGV